MSLHPTICHWPLHEQALVLLFSVIIVGFLQFLVIVGCMVSLYRAVFDRECASDRFRFNPDNSTPIQCNLSNAMRVQGIWYSASYLLWYLPTTIYLVIFETILGISPFFIMIISAFTVNFIGFTNAVVYLRPRYLELLRDNPTLGRMRILQMTINDQRRHRSPRGRTSLPVTRRPSTVISPSNRLSDEYDSSFSLLRTCKNLFRCGRLCQCCDKSKNKSSLQETPSNDHHTPDQEEAGVAQNEFDTGRYEGLGSKSKDEFGETLGEIRKGGTLRIHDDDKKGIERQNEEGQ